MVKLSVDDLKTAYYLAHYAHNVITGMHMKLVGRILAHLRTQPNGSNSDWGIMNALYPDAQQGSPANGARIANIRRTVHSHEDLCFSQNDSRIVYLIEE